MRIIAIIQARMGSTRLPGKILKKVMDKTLLEYQLERVKRSTLIADIVVATTENELDDVVVEKCKELGIRVFRGSESDVLDRYYKAAIEYKADVVVRLTSDCPLIDPNIIDRVIQLYVDQHEEIDYVSNTLHRTFPRGLDTEVFTFKALNEAWQNSLNPSDREHVTAYLYKYPEKFRLGNLTCSLPMENYRWTVDTIEDFELIKLILENIYSQNPHFTTQDVIDLLTENPKWNLINAHIEQKKV